MSDLKVNLDGWFMQKVRNLAFRKNEIIPSEMVEKYPELLSGLTDVFVDEYGRKIPVCEQINTDTAKEITMVEVGMKETRGRKKYSVEV